MLQDLSYLEPIAHLDNGGLRFYNQDRLITLHKDTSEVVRMQSSVTLGTIFGWEVAKIDFVPYFYRGKRYNGYEFTAGDSILSIKQLINIDDFSWRNMSILGRLNYLARKLWQVMGRASEYSCIEDLIIHIVKQMAIDFVTCTPNRGLDSILFESKNGVYRSYGYIPLESSYLSINHTEHEEDTINTLVGDYDSGPFSTIPIENLVADKMVKLIISNMKFLSKDFAALDKAKVNPFHKFLVVERMKYLINGDSWLNCG